jgi:glycine dehydrogenase
MDPLDSFGRRHLGSDSSDIQKLVESLALPSLDALIDATVPPAIRLVKPLSLPAPVGEHAALSELRHIASRNKLKKSFIGQGYHGCITPPVILRNILENPGILRTLHIRRKSPRAGLRLWQTSKPW